MTGMPQLRKSISYSPHRLAILLCFVAIISYLAAKLGTTVVISPQSDWTMWPGNILLSCILLLVPRRIWPSVVAVALVVFAVYDLHLGLSFRTVLFFELSDSVEALTAAFGLSYAFGGPPQLNSLKALAKYAFLAVLLAPFAGAFLGAATSHGGYPTGWGRLPSYRKPWATLPLGPQSLGGSTTAPRSSARP
jgi:integral membrane sensor domain MASE1